MEREEIRMKVKQQSNNEVEESAAFVITGAKDITLAEMLLRLIDVTIIKTARTRLRSLLQSKPIFFSPFFLGYGSCIKKNSTASSISIQSLRTDARHYFQQIFLFVV